jgi:crossover junction endodeoxyribonuclease RusA
VGAAPAVSFTVFGTPIAQGSKRLGRHGPHPVILDSNDKVLRPWREAVKAAALAVTNGRTVFARGTPVRMDVVFYLRRPAGHYGTGRNARQLKPSAPRYPTGTPDVDKLIRSLTDAITDSGAWWDDSQVVMYGPTGKRYADRCQPGAVVRLWVAP